MQKPVRGLERQMTHLREVNDILKKATVYFANPQNRRGTCSCKPTNCYSMRALCIAMQVSLSSYYAWCARNNLLCPANDRLTDRPLSR